MSRFLSRKIILSAMALILVAMVALPGFALAPPQAGAMAPSAPQAPMTEKQVIQLIKHNKKDLSSATSALTSNGVAFEVTPDLEQRLRKAGATDDLMATIQKVTPSARAAAAKARGQQAESAEERSAYAAIVKVNGQPDQLIPLAADFAQKYPKSQWLGFVYALQANAYEQKGDDARAVHFAQQSLELLPDNLMSLTIVATNLADPEMVNNLTDAQKAKNLDEAEKDAERALQLINRAPRGAKETDADYQKRKSAASTYADSALGMVHLQRAEMGLTPDPAELAKAEQSYEAACKDAPAPYAPDYYRLGQVLEDEGKADDAIAAFTKAAGAASNVPQLQAMAQQEIKKLKQGKATAEPSKQK